MDLIRSNGNTGIVLDGLARNCFRDERWANEINRIEHVRDRKMIEVSVCLEKTDKIFGDEVRQENLLRVARMKYIGLVFVPHGEFIIDVSAYAQDKLKIGSVGAIPTEMVKLFNGNINKMRFVCDKYQVFSGKIERINPIKAMFSEENNMLFLGIKIKFKVLLNNEKMLVGNKGNNV